ncbi:hypothetical protein H5410_064252 [Solanum commersonii]|uniref:Uncharacterized protein n=1 Tax=Solanum commersonii TaxID=4109 RepID=A0A9J5W019_SOLCO|nr:hypothetical protein H5410_064252 [Solanum commersonii]
MKKSLSHETPFQPKKLLNKFSKKLLVRKTTISVVVFSFPLFNSVTVDALLTIEKLFDCAINLRTSTNEYIHGFNDFLDKAFERGSQGEIIIPEVAYNWTMVTIREACRRNRSDLKMTYYDPYDNDDVRMTKRPGHIPEC